MPQYPPQYNQAPQQPLPPGASYSTNQRVEKPIVNQQVAPATTTELPYSDEAFNAVNQFYPPVQTFNSPYVAAVSQGNEKFSLAFFKVFHYLNFDVFLSHI